MKTRNDQIHDLLWREVAQKSTSASMAFIAVGIFFFFYHFKLEDYKILVQGAAVFVVVANLARLAISRRMIKSTVEVSPLVPKLKACIWTNSISWGVIYATGVFALPPGDPQLIVDMAVMLGFTAASIITLGYDRAIFVPHQILSVVPVAGILLAQYLMGQNDYGHYLFVNMAIFFAYQLKQFKVYREQILQRLNTQLDLVASYDELKSQTAKLIHASKLTALGEMAGGLAHEINNSTMAILASVQQIERELTKENLFSEKNKKRVDNVAGAVAKIKTVIDGLKFFSLESEGTQKKETPLSEILERTLHYSKEMIDAHGVEFTVDEIPDVKIHCQPFQITHILFSLIKNADDALSLVKSGPRWIRISFMTQDQKVRIKVINSGQTVPEEARGRIFQPFFTTKDYGRGTGLSLSIARGLALEHKGNLHFDSTSEGTIFTLELPESQGPEKQTFDRNYVIH